MQLAIAWADVALDPSVLHDVPVTPQFALDGFIHVALGLSFRDPVVNGDLARARQDAAPVGQRDQPTFLTIFLVEAVFGMCAFLASRGLMRKADKCHEFRGREAIYGFCFS